LEDSEERKAKPAQKGILETEKYAERKNFPDIDRKY
jgi:hypothetical protein